MNKWKVPLPAAKPDEGKKHIVIASGSRGGARLEFVGQLTDEQIKQIWDIAIPGFAAASDRAATTNTGADL
jgi:hypothetical protein